MRFTLFHFFYSTSFTVLFLLLAILVLITPADTIVQALSRNHRVYNVFVVAGCYLITALTALAIYVSRIYSVKRLMAEIPRSYVPVKKVHLPKRVHKAVAANLSRSAIIGVQSRPSETPAAQGGEAPIWGEIRHPGWSSPTSRELPNVQYLAIIQELPHLLELEALALYTPPPSQQSGYMRTPTSDVLSSRHFPDQEVLRRQQHATFRTYVGQLATMGFVRQDVADVFLAGYERARFRRRGRGIEEKEFMDLMKVFAGLLKSMGDDLVSDSSSASSRRQVRGWGSGLDENYPNDEDDRRESAEIETRYRYMSLGDETTTTEGEEEERLQLALGRAVGEHIAPNPWSSMRRRRAGTSGSATLERTATADSMTRSGDNGIEMTSLNPRMNRRLSVRASTGTFG